MKKFGRNGAFLACPGYPECKHTQPLDQSELPVPVEGIVPDCAARAWSRATARTGATSTARAGRSASTPSRSRSGVACPQCGKGEIAEKRSRKGKTFFSCTRYPDCDYALWDRPRPTPCPDCDGAVPG